MSEQNELLCREDIPESKKWHLTDIYATRTDWLTARDSLTAQLDEIAQYRGKLTEPQSLLECLTKVDTMEITLHAVFAYARMMADTDTANQDYQADAASCLPLLDQASSICSFIEPELLALPEDTLLTMADQLPDLTKYRFRFNELLRSKAHVLTAEQEAFLARTGEIRTAAHNAYTIMTNADLKFPDIHGENGKLTTLSESRYMQFIRSKKRSVRADAFQKLFCSYLSFRNTFASLYSSSIKASQFISTMRRYPSMLEAALDNDNIPTTVYEQTINVTHEFLPELHRYMSLKKKLLNVKTLHMYDLYVPIVEKPKTAYTFEQARILLKNALAPLGEQYLSDLFSGLDGGWVDRLENKGKRNGAYSWGVYGIHPFILMSWQDTYDAVSTLAHELGHSMHSFYSSKHQDYTNSEYTIFCAEVASTTNENLLLEYMLSHADKDERFYYLNLYLEQIRTTVFRQVLFAEFEKLTHEAVEKDETLTADKLEGLWMELNRQYYGDDVILDDELRAEWSRIPHFYRPFYVYQYATGYAAAITLSHKIRTGGQRSCHSYLNFLCSGGSDYSIRLLQKAGVDMASREPFAITFQKFQHCLEQLEKIVK